ncbi:glutathione S-transferase [Penicillium verhagenii]|nr:glutathione S-transferase [Penicillium verhagenii]
MSQIEAYRGDKIQTASAKNYAQTLSNPRISRAFPVRYWVRSPLPQEAKYAEKVRVDSCPPVDNRGSALKSTSLNLETAYGEDTLEPYPNVQAWIQRTESRPSGKRSMGIHDQLMDGQGLQPNGMPRGVTNVPYYEEFMAKSPEEQQKYLDSQK